MKNTMVMMLFQGFSHSLNNNYTLFIENSFENSMNGVRWFCPYKRYKNYEWFYQHERYDGDDVFLTRKPGLQTAYLKAL